jgi:hypothetical protein
MMTSKSSYLQWKCLQVGKIWKGAGTMAMVKVAVAAVAAVTAVAAAAAAVKATTDTMAIITDISIAMRLQLLQTQPQLLPQQ